jgi:DUF1680 family protein
MNNKRFLFSKACSCPPQFIPILLSGGVRGFLFFLLFFLASPLRAVDKLTFFPLSEVRLLPGVFEHAQELDRQYLLTLDADRLLAPYLREAGLTPKAQSYTNWENTGLDGHIGGHYLSALAMMWASTGDKEIEKRFLYVLAELKRCQQQHGTGYLGGVPGGVAMWNDIAQGKIQAGSFDLNKKWVPLYNIHKTYAGLRDAYLHTGNTDALEMLIAMSDWFVKLVQHLTDDQIQDMLRSEHGGLNEVFADVAAITGNEKYLRLAHQFSHQFILQPLLKNEDKLTGLHANTQIPKVIGFKRIAEVEGLPDWTEAARFFWEKVVSERSVSFGGNSAFEHFHPTGDFSRMLHGTEGPETCNTYNMLRLSKMFYGSTAQSRYLNFYERGLYNHILSSQHPEHGGLVYFTQIRPGHYRVYSQPHTSMWCCVGSGIENHAKYGELIYARKDNDLFVNLFIASTLNWEEKNLQLVQQTSFPDNESTVLTIKTKKRHSFTLNIRYPEWVEKGKLQIKINGRLQKNTVSVNGYVALHRKWRNGDKIEVSLPMSVSVEQLPDGKNYYSFLYGPLVLAAKVSTEHLDGLKADDSRGGHIAKGKVLPINEMPVLVSEKDALPGLLTKVKGKSLTFKVNALYGEKYSSGMELIPFFRLHDARYIMYWPQATPSEVKAISEQNRLSEAEKIKLEAATIDKVICGEQQPESDHFIASHRSGIGYVADRHYREASGWFSYKFRNANRTANRIRIAHTDTEWPRDTEVFVNDEKIGEILTRGTDINEVLVKEFDVPVHLQTVKELTVRIAPKGNSTTARVFEIRTLQAVDN